MANLKPTEILSIVLVVLLPFGAKRLPDLAKGVGKSVKILKSEVKDLSDDHHTPAPATPFGVQASLDNARTGARAASARPPDPNWPLAEFGRRQLHADLTFLSTFPMLGRRPGAG